MKKLVIAALIGLAALAGWAGESQRNVINIPEHPPGNTCGAASCN